jgi:hypothetical protein
MIVIAQRIYLVVLVVAAAAVCTAASQAAPAADWVTSRSSAQRGLSERFKNIASVSCAPDRSSATLLQGNTRYWQRFSCQGRTFDGVSFRLNFKVTGQCASCWTIFGLTGTGVHQLRTKAVKKSSGGTSSTPTRNCHPSYQGACLDPNASDYDCAGGSGNGPYYTGPVRVVGPDVFGLDADGDGYGCE